jgi:hypothetical protein
LRVFDQEAFMKLVLRSQYRLWILLLTVTVGSAAAVRADDGHSGHPHFTARDINRSYGFSCSGTIVAPARLPSPEFLGPFAQVGQVSCDGRNTCSGTSRASFNGIIVSASVTGPYTVNSNGTGTVTYTVAEFPPPDNVLPIFFVITHDGRGIKGLPTLPGYAVTCDLKEQ